MTVYVYVQVAVAVKTLYGQTEVQEQFIKEANSMCSLNHKHIIQLYGIVLSHPLMLVCPIVLQCMNLSVYMHTVGRVGTLYEQYVLYCVYSI